MLDLEEVRQRRRKDEQQLPRQQQNKEHDEVTKLKGEDNGSKSPSVAAVPALPERIQKPQGDSSPDQCRKEEGDAAAGGGGTTRTRLLLPLTHRGRSMITKKMTEPRVQRN
jgi:hypothetical protein